TVRVIPNGFVLEFLARKESHLAFIKQFEEDLRFIVRHMIIRQYIKLPVLANGLIKDLKEENIARRIGFGLLARCRILHHILIKVILDHSAQCVTVVEYHLPIVPEFRRPSLSRYICTPQYSYCNQQIFCEGKRHLVYLLFFNML